MDSHTVLRLLIILIFFTGMARSIGSYPAGPYVYIYNEDGTKCLTSQLVMHSNLNSCSQLSVYYEPVDPSGTMLLYFLEEQTYINMDGINVIKNDDAGKVFSVVDVSSSEYTTLQHMLSQGTAVYITATWPDDPRTVSDAGCVETSFVYTFGCSLPLIWTFVRTCGEISHCSSCDLSDDTAVIHNECTECEGDLVVNSNKEECIACEDAMTNCTVCTAHNECTDCATGFGVNANGDGCTACSEAMEDCTECEAFNSCTACSGGKVPKDDSSGCETCPTGQEANSEGTACVGDAATLKEPSLLLMILVTVVMLIGNNA